MKNKTLLILSTFNFLDPVQGGEQRCFEIRKKLLTYFNVIEIFFVLGTENKIEWPNIYFDKKIYFSKFGQMYNYELKIFEYLKTLPRINKKIFEYLNLINPDIFWFEHPYCWPLINSYLNIENIYLKNKIIVYSSHNVEFQLKRQCYKSFCGSLEINKNVLTIKKLELDLAMNSQFILSVSKGDKNTFERLGVKKNKSIVINNSCFPLLPFLEIELVKKNYWHKKLEKYVINFIFVGSWHPPNMDGFFEYIHPDFFEKAKAKKIALWIVGGVGNGLLDDVRFKPYLKFLKVNLFLTGKVDSEVLSIIYNQIDCAILPIKSGGGTNIKTVEALNSCKPIISTKFSFRGFEKYIDSKHSIIASTPKKFMKVMLDYHHQLKERNKNDPLLSKLNWDYQLKKLIPKLEYLKKI
jgi:hypothetical protein